jgi:hypothetical protein
MRIDPKHLAAFRAAIGARDDDSVCVLYPHVLGFRLQMALLTHLAFPLPIWNALQIRNRLVRHRAIEPGATLELWLKGPVFYGEEVALSANTRDGAVQFGLALAGDSRMALRGSWHGAVAPI